MSWAVIRNPSGTALVELDALAGPHDEILSRHETIGEARQALVEYRARQEREAALEAGQKEFPW